MLRNKPLYMSLSPSAQRAFERMKEFNRPQVRVRPAFKETKNDYWTRAIAELQTK